MKSSKVQSKKICIIGNFLSTFEMFKTSIRFLVKKNWQHFFKKWASQTKSFFLFLLLVLYENQKQKKKNRKKTMFPKIVKNFCITSYSLFQKVLNFRLINFLSNLLKNLFFDKSRPLIKFL